jgi:leucyl-tRNA synthetase
MFGYRWSEGGPWNTENIAGVVRWLNRVWTLFTEPAGQNGEPDAENLRALRRKVHQTLIQVTDDFEKFEFNTIISGLMELLNEMYRLRELGAAGTPAWEEARDLYLRMLAPVAPHIAEELWTEILGLPYSVHQQPWPEVDLDATRAEEVVLVVQVNGKVRDRLTVPAGLSDQAAEEAALASEAVQKHLGGKAPRKVIVVPDKLVNIVG